ncbi:hypothetical protein SCHPADRAFT_110 [Schizopora paradoxa]|uniref:Uncharacterized protein n=1 Tax=Schizopora paradoxa TaxID=27342 RepID=A0A0H2S8N6_9AGAM|nr:hypothetical protein SCHPADRAFT_110 [Schizopora paradoxa]
MMVDPISIGGHLATLKAMFDKVKTNRKNLIQLAENLANMLEVLEGVQKGIQGARFSGVPHDAVSELRIEFEALLHRCENLLDKTSSSLPTGRVGSFAKATSATSSGHTHFSNNGVALMQPKNHSHQSASPEYSTVHTRMSSKNAEVPQEDQATEPTPCRPSYSAWSP